MNGKHLKMEVIKIKHTESEMEGDFRELTERVGHCRETQTQPY
jgi:hypothetical protein